MGGIGGRRRNLGVCAFKVAKATALARARRIDVSSRTLIGRGRLVSGGAVADPLSQTGVRLRAEPSGRSVPPAASPCATQARAATRPQVSAGRRPDRGAAGHGAPLRVPEGAGASQDGAPGSALRGDGRTPCASEAASVPHAGLALCSGPHLHPSPRGSRPPVPPAVPPPALASPGSRSCAALGLPGLPSRLRPRAPRPPCPSSLPHFLKDNSSIF